MAIDVEPRDLGKVIQLVARNESWKKAETRFTIDRTTLITGNPNPEITHQAPAEIIKPLRQLG